MKPPLPQPPASLGPLAREVLEFLAGHADAAEIVIGGGVALAHYLDYRDTHDLDAWWATAPTGAATALLREAVTSVGRRHGLGSAERAWGETLSLELLDADRKVFSLQIAPRDRYLDATLEAAWPPVRIETLRDNVASKMTALVERGAPRDLRDIHRLCTGGLLTMADCWAIYEQKNPGRTSRDGAAKVLHAVERLELQRPLDRIAAEQERREAETVRRWYRDVFCRHPSPHHEPA